MVFGDGAEEILGGVDGVPLEPLVFDGVADVSIAKSPRLESRHDAAFDDVHRLLHEGVSHLIDGLHVEQQRLAAHHVGVGPHGGLESIRRAERDALRC